MKLQRHLLCCCTMLFNPSHCFSVCSWNHLRKPRVACRPHEHARIPKQVCKHAQSADSWATLSCPMWSRERRNSLCKTLPLEERFEFIWSGDLQPTGSPSVVYNSGVKWVAKMTLLEMFSLWPNDQYCWMKALYAKVQCTEIKLSPLRNYKILLVSS